MLMNTGSEVIANELEEMFEELNQRFIREAIVLWDKKVGILPHFADFIDEVTLDKWEDYASRN